MAVIRVLLLALVAFFFVITVSLVLFQDTGAVEKVALLGVAVLLALSVPVIRRLGNPATR
jgi:hypothetical protein